jgi:tRNA/rRNA methyltransferase
LAIELVTQGESDSVLTDRAERRRWLETRDYRVVDVPAADVETRLADVLDHLERELATTSATRR